MNRGLKLNDRLTKELAKVKEVAAIDPMNRGLKLFPGDFFTTTRPLLQPLTR